MNYDDLNKIAKTSTYIPNENLFVELLRIIKKYKIFLIVTFMLIVGGAAYYNFSSTPLYESKILLKKETIDRNARDDLQDLFYQQSPDELETEIEMVKTNQVLGTLVEEQKLYLSVNEAKFKDGRDFEFNYPLIDYEEKTGNSSSFPQFTDIKYTPTSKSYDLLLKKVGPNTVELYQLITTPSFLQKLIPFDISSVKKELINSYKIGSGLTINLDSLEIAMLWPSKGSLEEFHFSIQNYYSTINKYRGRIDVSKIEKTNLFTISVQSTTSYSAHKLAAGIADVFRDIRISQQKETVKYSFNFIDSQLGEVSEKLKKAEQDLSTYKSRNGITEINQSSEELVNSLSNLQAQKISTDIELAEYQNKLQELSKEMETNEYLDQTYLTPTEGVSDQSNSPFASLMRQLADLEVEKIKLLQKKKESHPDVVSIDNQIKEIKEKLGKYNQNTVTAYRIIIKALEEKQQRLADLIDQYSSKVSVLPRKESQLAGLMREKNVYEKVFTLLLNKREEMRMKELSKLQDLIIADPATIPLNPSSPKLILNLILGIFVWGILAFGFLLFRVHKDNQLIKLEDIEDLLQLPILSIIPNYTRKFKKRLKANYSKAEDNSKSNGKSVSYIPFIEDGGGMQEAYKLLSAKYSNLERKMTIFTSVEEGTGKTSVVANLGLVLAMQGKDVLVIDADLKRSTLTDQFKIPRETLGLISWLNGNFTKLPIWDPMSKIKMKNLKGSLSIVPSGGVTEESLELLDSKKAINFFSTIQSSAYDYILIDTPPVTRVVDTIILARMVQNVMLVVRPGLTRKDSLEFGIKELRDENTNPFGVIVNACDVENTIYKHRYGYAYGYEYNYSSNGRKKRSSKIKSLVS